MLQPQADNMNNCTAGLIKIIIISKKSDFFNLNQIFLFFLFF